MDAMNTLFRKIFEVFRSVFGLYGGAIGGVLFILGSIVFALHYIAEEKIKQYSYGYAYNTALGTASIGLFMLLANFSRPIMSQMGFIKDSTIG